MLLGLSAIFSFLDAYLPDLMQKATEMKWHANIYRPWSCCHIATVSYRYLKYEKKYSAVFVM